MEWLRSRFGVLQALSLHIVIGLILSFGFLAFFSELAEEILEQDFVVTLDNAIAHAFHVNATPVANLFFLTVTRFGLEILWIIVIGFTAYFIYKRHWVSLLMLAVSIGGGWLLNSSLKFFFSRPRPVFDDPIITALHYSFPSGHAMLSFIAYGLLAYYLVQRSPNRLRKVLIMLNAILLIGLIGLSRIYLGVHYLSDVIAGYAAGGFWLSTCTTSFYYFRNWYRQRKKEPTPEMPPASGEPSPQRQL